MVHFRPAELVTQDTAVGGQKTATWSSTSVAKKIPRIKKSH